MRHGFSDEQMHEAEQSRRRGSRAGQEGKLGWIITGEGFVVGGEPGALRGDATDDGHGDAAQQQHGGGGGHPTTTPDTPFSSSSSSMASAPPHHLHQNLPAANGNRAGGEAVAVAAACSSTH